MRVILRCKKIAYSEKRLACSRNNTVQFQSIYDWFLTKIISGCMSVLLISYNSN